MRIISSDDYVVAVAHIDEKSEMSLFSDYRLERIAGLKSAKAIKRSMAAEFAMIRAMAVFRPQMTPPFDCRAGDNGKPYYTNSDVNFNVSHSGEYAVCAVSCKVIGIDIEQQARTYEDVAKKFFTSNEQRLCENDGFTRIWTRKEAVAKADGTGIGIGFASFDVTGDIAVCGGVKYRLINIDAPVGYVISLAYKDG